MTAEESRSTPRCTEEAEGEGIKPEGTRRSEFEIQQAGEQRREHNLSMGDGREKKTKARGGGHGKGKQEKKWRQQVEG